MSLKNFHLLFIVASVILAAGFGLWCFSERGRSVAGSTVMGTVSLLAAAGLVVYAIKFLQKLNREGID